MKITKKSLKVVCNDILLSVCAPGNHVLMLLGNQQEMCALSKPSSNPKGKDIHQTEMTASFRAHRIAKRLASAHSQHSLTGSLSGIFIPGSCAIIPSPSSEPAIIQSPSSEPEDSRGLISISCDDSKESCDQTGNPEEVLISVRGSSNTGTVCVEGDLSPV